MTSPGAIRPEGTALADAVSALRDATARLSAGEPDGEEFDQIVAEINRLSQEIAECLPRALREAGGG